VRQTIFFLSCLHNVCVLLGVASQANVLESHYKRRLRAKSIIAAADHLGKACTDAGLFVGAYSATKSPLYADKLDKLLRTIPELLGELEACVTEGEEQSLVITKIRALTNETLQLVKARRDQITDGKDIVVHRARHMTDGSGNLISEVVQQLGILTQEERSLDSEQSDAARNMRLKLNTMLNLGFVGSLFFALAMIAVSTSNKSQDRLHH